VVGLRCSRQSNLPPDNLHDSRVRIGRRSPCVDQHNSLCFASSNRQIGIVDSSEKAAAFLFEAILVVFGAAISRRVRFVTAACAFDAGGYIRIHKDREIRLQAVAQDAMQCEYQFASQFAAATLIGFGGIRKAVTENDLAIRQRGLDHFCNVLCARCEHQCQFRHWGEAVSSGIEEEAPDFLSRRGSAWFAGDYYRQALRSQNVRKLFQLRALAAAIESFEGDEAAAMRVGRHSGNHKSARGILYKTTGVCGAGALARRF